jgi:hypothetical protein
MAKSSLSFGMIKIEISDNRSSIEELTNMAYATLDLLIPKAEKLVLEEKNQMLKAQAKNECEDDEECPFATKEKEAQKGLNELYV